ncbi:hypothetical protein [Pandoravirus japonicus]|uniref:Uncharacterized protein n=1 Tax=Pandoravirus japonicus TaxID=2823154 RepID=A0A811BQM2_9VIRU|nr:hypothetical protein [Pandoravirus japonicus]
MSVPERAVVVIIGQSCCCLPRHVGRFLARLGFDATTRPCLCCALFFDRTNHRRPIGRTAVGIGDYPCPIIDSESFFPLTFFLVGRCACTDRRRVVPPKASLWRHSIKEDTFFSE